jgi:membrane protein DedA with SNARE-associated domain
MNGEAWVQAAARLPVLLFILIVAALVLVSVAGFPVPITITLLLAGALAMQMHNGWLVFILLVLAVALTSTLRDIIALYLGRGGGALWQRFIKRKARSAPEAHGVAVRDTRITAPPQRPSLLVLADRLRRSDITNGTVLAAAERAMHGEEWAVLALTRLSPLASPFDLAVGALGMQLRTFIPPIFTGRIFYALVLLGAGAVSGAAWQHGGNLPTLIGILSVVLIVIMILPDIINRRLGRSRPPVAARSAADATMPGPAAKASRPFARAARATGDRPRSPHQQRTAAAPADRSAPGAGRRMAKTTPADRSPVSRAR